MPISLELANASDAPWLTTRLRALLKLLNLTTGNWSIAFVRDAAMKQLHTRTMNIPTTTDVLTFDLRDVQSKKSPLDLDTVICLDEARRRAREFRHPLKHELLLYALHSLLHVQGYDDHIQIDAQKMHRREDELLVALGIGAVYRKPTVASKRRHPRPPAKPRPRARRKRS